MKSMARKEKREREKKQIHEVQLLLCYAQAPNQRAWVPPTY
jgi:hypothetical protein